MSMAMVTHGSTARVLIVLFHSGTGWVSNMDRDSQASLYKNAKPVRRPTHCSAEIVPATTSSFWAPLVFQLVRRLVMRPVVATGSHSTDRMAVAISSRPLALRRKVMVGYSMKNRFRRSGGSVRPALSRQCDRHDVACGDVVPPLCGSERRTGAS